MNSDQTLLALFALFGFSAVALVLVGIILHHMEGGAPPASSSVKASPGRKSPLSPCASLSLGMPTPRLFLQAGERRRVSAVYQGTHSRLGEVTIFDFAFDFPEGGGLAQTVVVACLLRRKFPAMELEPRKFNRRFLTKSTLCTFSDRTLPFDFLTAYQVYARSEEAALRSLTPPAMAGLAKREGWWIETEGPWILACRPNVKVPPARHESLLQQVSELAGMLG